MRNRLSLILLTALLVAGCGNHSKKDVLPPRKFAAFLYDYHLAQAIGNDLKPDDKYKQKFYLNYVFESHGVTQEEYDASLIWYTRHPNELHDIYVELSERAGNENKVATMNLEKIQKKKIFIAESGDSVDLWYLKRNSLIAQTPMLNPLVFSIDVDSTFHISDSLKWNVGVALNGVIPDSIIGKTGGNVYLSLSLAYKDSISSADTLISENGVYRLSLQCDDKKLPDRLMGSILYLNAESDTMSLALLHNISLIRLHKRSVVDTDTVSGGMQVTDSLEVF